MPRFEIIYTASYEKRAVKFLKRHPELLNQYRKCLELLETDPYHPSLRLHRLKGFGEDVYSVSINLNYRIVMIFLIADDKIIPVEVGSHDQVYR